MSEWRWRAADRCSSATSPTASPPRASPSSGWRPVPPAARWCWSAELLGLDQVDIEIAGGSAASLVQEGLQQLATLITGNASSGTALAQGLESAVELAVGEGMGALLRETVGERELTTFEPPQVGDARVDIDRAQLHSADGGLFIGLDPAGWPTGGVEPSWHPQDVTVLVSSEGASAALYTASGASLLPRGIGLNGQPSENGIIQIRPRSLSFTEQGVDAVLRVGRTASQCGWLDLGAHVDVALAEDDSAEDPLSVAISRHPAPGRAGGWSGAGSHRRALREPVGRPRHQHSRTPLGRHPPAGDGSPHPHRCGRAGAAWTASCGWGRTSRWGRHRSARARASSEASEPDAAGRWSAFGEATGR